jgi:hypothetical protein
MNNLLFLFVIIILSIHLTSCIPEEIDNRPECEKENYGTVKVINKSSIALVVDVTWTGVATNSEKTIFPGTSVTYNYVPAGIVLVWQKPWPQNDGWSYSEITIHACKTFTFSWVDK